MVVKYRELIRRLRRIAAEHDSRFTLIRNGANHELWAIRDERIVIPRHREINERTANSIIRHAKEVARHDDD